MTEELRIKRMFTNLPASSSSNGLISSSVVGFLANTSRPKPWSTLHKELILDPCFNRHFTVSSLRPSVDALPGVLGVLGREDVNVCGGGLVCLVFAVFFFFTLLGERLGFVSVVGEGRFSSEMNLRFPRLPLIGAGRRSIAEV